MESVCLGVGRCWWVLVGVVGGTNTQKQPVLSEMHWKPRNLGVFCGVLEGASW